MRDSLYGISYISDIDFIGDGTGVAISAASTVWTKNCRFEGWKTALLGFGNVWINTTDCTFENNGIGLHWNSTDVTAVDSHYTGNIFRGNDTAVLLEQVSTDTVLNFGQCVFENNETDLDNRCSQPVDLSEAEFR